LQSRVESHHPDVVVMYPSGGDSGAVSIEGDRHDSSFGLIADAGARTGRVALDQHVRNVKDAAVEDR